jgi:methionyl-tRNA synthetase
VNLVEAGLQDVSISRKGFTWGIPVPFDREQTIYVWFDALLNYITGIGYGTDDERFRATWPADVHVIGKDITRFHCALWPAMLMSAGLPLPRRVFGHGFVYNKGAKISKSAGTAIDPMDVFRVHGADAFRYYFMRECPFGGDGNFSDERFAEVYNADLADNLGNLYSRTLSMCVKYFDGRLDGASEVVPTAWLAGLDLPALVADLRERIGAFEYNVALQRIWLDVLGAANRYIEETKPFKLAKTDRDACRAVLVNLAEALRVVAILIKPFLPRTAETFYRAFDFEAEKPWDRVGYADAVPRAAAGDLRVTAGLVGGKPSPLFPRIDTKDAG